MGDVRHSSHVFIGHYAVGFALKRAAPGVSLGWLVLAAQLPDMLWPIFLLLGWEYVAVDPGNTRFTPLAFDSYPYSHSLLLVAVWGAALGGLYLTRRRPVASGVVLALGAISHWVLDWITHRPDLPLVPWSAEKVGLGLWNSVPATLGVEIPLFVIGVWVYARATRAERGGGDAGFAAFVVVLALIYAGNLFSPPPPDARSVALVSLGLWLFPGWAAWIDGRRRFTAASLRS
jgi:membrane-bound metal-dependent hydrolase YbcI (DUF457 family)